MGAEMLITGPVPGNSLTRTPGNSVWEQPPLHTKLNDVVTYYSDMLVSKESLKMVKQAAEVGIYMTDIAEVMLKAGVMKGIHSIDSGMIVFPILVELLKAIGEISGASRLAVDQEEEVTLDEQTFIDVMNEAKVAGTEEQSSIPSKGLMVKGEKQ